MTYRLVQNGAVSYLESAAGSEPIRSEQDALDAIAQGWEHGTSRLLLHADMLSDEFMNLRTGLAGAILQKFANYGLKAAVVLPDSRSLKGRFKELVAEANRSREFRVFENRDEAEAWLIG